MKKNLLSKTLVIGIIIIFVGASVIPSVMSAEKQKLQAVTTMQNTWYVDDNGNNSNSGTSWEDAWEHINYAIGHTSVIGGDTIRVGDGTYYENVILDRRIFLTGNGSANTIIDGGGVGDVVYVSVNSVSISEFTIRNSGIGEDPCSGIVVATQERISIIKNTITDNQYGIEIAGNECIVSGNIITNNSCGIQTFGILNTFSRNNISNNNYSGIQIMGFLDFATRNKIYNNNFINNPENAFFMMAPLNFWFLNYWDRPRLLPYPIFGFLALIPPIPWFQFDWRPALKPNDISQVAI